MNRFCRLSAFKEGDSLLLTTTKQPKAGSFLVKQQLERTFLGIDLNMVLKNEEILFTKNEQVASLFEDCPCKQK